MSAALDALRLGRILGIPYSVTAHAFDIYREPRNLGEKLEQASFATSGCDYTVRDLRRIAGADAARRIHKIVMGVDGGRFPGRPAAPGGRHVIAVGRLVEKKGFDVLIAAAALLERRTPLEQVTIVGAGPLSEQLERQAEQSGVS